MGGDVRNLINYLYLNMCTIKQILTVRDEINPTEKEVSYALLAVRIATGIFFATHGYAKFFGDKGLDGFAGMLDNMGFPIVGVLAFLVAFAELFGGLAIIFGFLTRFSAFWLAIISIVAWWVAKGFELPKGDIDLLALGLTLALLAAGPGMMSVSAYFKKQ